METVIHWAIVFAVLCIASWSWLQVRLFVLVADGLMAISGSVFALMVAKNYPVFLAFSAAIALSLLLASAHNLLIINLGLDEIIVGVAFNLISAGALRAIVYWTAQATAINFNYLQISLLASFGYWVAPFVATSILLSVYLARNSALWPMIAAIEQNPEWAREIGVRVLSVRWLVVSTAMFFIIVNGTLRVAFNKEIAVDQWSDGIGFLALGVAFFARANLSIVLLLSVIYAILQAMSTQNMVRQVLGVHLADFLPIASVLLSMLVAVSVRYLKHRRSSTEIVGTS